jgi:hypothetical protein
MLVAAAFPLAACSSSSDTSLSKPFKAQVITYLAPDDPEDAGSFKLATREFSTLNSFDALSGDFVKIVRGGALSIKSMNGSLVASDGFAGGSSPALRYRVEKNTAIPRDYATLAMLSAFYQFDHIFSTMEDTIGVDPDEFLEVLGTPRMKVLFEPEISLSTDSTSASQVDKLNAAFVPTAKQFLLFQRSPLEAIPLAASLQVLSHEFGHAVFDYSFFGGQTDPDDGLADEYAISGINEGFADFMSYTYCHSADILAGSFASKSMTADRNFLKTTFTYDTLEDENNDECSGSFYCIGTLFARALYNTKAALTSVTQKEFEQTLITALKTTKAAMTTRRATLLPTRSSHDENGQILGLFFSSLIPILPTTWTSDLCQNLISEFGDVGFPASAREGVCP